MWFFTQSLALSSSSLMSASESSYMSFDTLFTTTDLAALSSGEGIGTSLAKRRELLTSIEQSLSASLGVEQVVMSLKFLVITLTTFMLNSSHTFSKISSFSWELFSHLMVMATHILAVSLEELGLQTRSFNTEQPLTRADEAQLTVLRLYRTLILKKNEKCLFPNTQEFYITFR